MLNRQVFIDLLERALWTFVQTAVAVLAVSNEPFSKAALLAAAAAGLSAVKTVVLAKVRN